MNSIQFIPIEPAQVIAATWAVAWGDVELGVLERLDMGDDDEYVYTTYDGRQHRLDAYGLLDAGMLVLRICQQEQTVKH